MSRTKRKDLYVDQLADRRYPASEEDKIKAHKDGKKWYKLPKKAKKLSRKRDEAKPKQVLRNALATGRDIDDIVLPDAKKHDRWDAT